MQCRGILPTLGDAFPSGEKGRSPSIDKSATVGYSHNEGFIYESNIANCHNLLASILMLILEHKFYLLYSFVSVNRLF